MSGDTGSDLARQARQLIRSKRYREAFQLAARARDQSPRCAQVSHLSRAYTLVSSNKKLAFRVGIKLPGTNFLCV